MDEYKIKKEEIEKKYCNTNCRITFEDFTCFKEEFNLNSILNIKNMPSFQYFFAKKLY